MVFCWFIPTVLAIGCYHGKVHLQAPFEENHIYNRLNEKTNVVLIGTMATMAGFDGETSQVTIETRSIRHKDDAALLPTKGKILLRLPGPWPEQLSPGDTLAIRTELKRPDSFRTPGVFDYAQYLARKDIWLTGFVHSPLFLHKIEEKHSFFHSLRYVSERLRTRIGKHIDRAVPARISGVYRALLLGDRSNIDEDTLEIFKGSGTMHILAISGLHMAVIGTLLYTTIFWLLSRSETLLLRFTIKKWAAFFSLPVLLGYGLLAGMNTPVVRAVIMSSVVIVALCTNRQKSPGALVAFAALLILAIDPVQLFTVSFQLSFSAIIGILFLLPILKRLLFTSTESSAQPPRREKIVNWLAAGLLVSLVANLATAPIALTSFNRFSTVGPLANLVIEPLICLWSLAAGFLAIPFIFLQPETATCLLQFGAMGLDAAMHAAAFFSSFSFSTIWLPTPPTWLLVIYFYSLTGFAYSCSKKKWWTLPALCSLSVCIWLFIHPPKDYQAQREGFFRISYLDVGQGTATFLEYPSGLRVLIDGGGSSFATTSVGERVIAPFLWTKGIGKIDAVIITHPDADHYNGLGFIIKHFLPRRVWVRDKDGHDNTFKRLVHLAENQGAAVSIPENGDFLQEESTSLQCVANISAGANSALGYASANSGNNGLVVKACARQFCALFPGDIGRSTEQALIDQGFHLNADILLSPHHGSITSNSRHFLQAVAPKHLLVSAGRSTKGYFPHQGLARECENQSIKLFTTSDQGTLQVIVGQESSKIYGYEREDSSPLSSFRSVLLDEEEITPR
ncbi:DNA internalization-related competence protein ComEC/Rec2 [Desulfocastanea catecholica]